MQGGRPRLKVCCIASRAEAALAIGQGADALGLVGAMPSGPGPIADDRIADIVAAVPPPIATFLLSSRQEAEGLAEHVRITGANTLQIVDHLDPSQYPRLRRLLPTTRLVQVIHVQGAEAVALATDYARLADALLLDSGRPGAPFAELGGTGRVHDWRISRDIVARVEKPVFLAGGLNPGNVAEAVATVRPFGVDLCSGLRSEGRLDPAKLAAFTAALWPGR
ncbi:MAG: phosphoribosylanthranilate isomerase [Alphaproteobacteria bacterium]|nr:phosphoribosylanthranilate isomerase [Alphaproteobacteria bacterium]